MATTTFTCERCRRSFEKGWTDEEARAEAASMPWAPTDVDDEAVLCDDCFEEFLAWQRSLRQR